jgi:hypothetical protein
MTTSPPTPIVEKVDEKLCVLDLPGPDINAIDNIANNPKVG